MDFTVADRVWNRAALESGGGTPGNGDRALANLLLLHGLVMNGGVHHAIESLRPSEVAAAAAGFSFFGLDDVAAFLRGVAAKSAPSELTDQAEERANRSYSAMIPDDEHLARCFERVFHERPHQFAPVE